MLLSAPSEAPLVRAADSRHAALLTKRAELLREAPCARAERVGPQLGNARASDRVTKSLEVVGALLRVGIALVRRHHHFAEEPVKQPHVPNRKYPIWGD